MKTLITTPICKLLALATLLLISTLSLGAVSNQSIDKLFELSGLTNQVKQIPGVIGAGLQQAHQSGTPIPDEEFNALQTSVEETIHPSDILDVIRSALKQSITEEEAQSLLSWYQSDLGREITQEEEAASTPEAYGAMIAEAEAVLANKDKVAFAKRLDKLLGGTEMTLDLQKHASVAVYSAMMSALQPGKPVNLDQIESQVEAGLKQNRGKIEQMVQLSLAYSYRNIEATKLEKYEAFLNKPETVEFNNTVKTSFNTGLKQEISDWAHEIASMLASTP